MLLHPDMGCPAPGEKPEAMQWPIGGVFSPPRTPLRAINTRRSESSSAVDVEEDEDYCCSTATTPTAKEARIPEQPLCPPAPRKKRPPLRCPLSSGVEFFSCPPDLEAVFMRLPEKAK